LIALTIEEHIQVLHDLARAEHERWIAEVQGRADDAGAEGDVESQRRFLGQVEGLRAIPYPWEAAPAA
jgi:hypothetical protein